MKRSSVLPVVMLGLAGVLVYGAFSQEETVSASTFSDPKNCLSAVGSAEYITPESCEKGFEEAKAEHERTAPRYDSKQVCEAEHGEGNCDVSAEQSGGGFSFMPLFVGYMIGSMLGGGRPIAQPLVTKAGGGVATPAGATVKGLNTTTNVGKSAFTPAATTLGKPPMTKAQVAARGGFGASKSGISLGG